MLKSSEKLQPAGRAEDLFTELRRMIVTGELRPNEPLIEADLAERLDVSRTPIRESLQRLAALGLIVPRKRGWAVREYSAAEAMQRFEIRMVLESYAAALAAERGTDAELALCNRIHLDRLTVDPADEERRVSTNRTLHAAIIAAAHNDQLTESIYETGRFYLIAPVARATTRADMEISHAEHAEIIAALLARNPARAEDAMRRHLRRTFEMYRSIEPGLTPALPPVRAAV